MKIFVQSALLAATFGLPAFAEVGISVNIGEPGFFGQIELGDTPPPQLIYPQPVIVQPAPAAEAPVYLRVPPGYESDWRHHCGEYGACGRPVYFVRDDWYRSVYAPHYRARHPERFEHQHARGDDRDDDRDRDPRGRGHDRDRD